MKHIHGGDIYRNQIRYDFSVSINPLGMPDKSVRAAKAGIMCSAHYPDVLGETLRTALGRKERLTKEEILLGNGAAELLYALAAVQKPKRALLIAPSFSEYEAALRTIDCKLSFYKLQADRQFQIEEDILQFLTEETDILFLCNPNNPTGYLTDRALLCRMAEACEKNGITFVVDECFLGLTEYEKDATMLPFLEEYRHLVIVKAFTKLYAMPGLRLGYALSADTHLLEKMREGMQPWNTSLPAQMAGAAALGEYGYLKKTQVLLTKEKKYLLEQLRGGLAETVYGSSANFIFFKAEEGLAEAMLREKIMIRDCSNFRTLPKGYYRIAVRTHAENRKLLAAWRRIRRKAEWQK